MPTTSVVIARDEWYYHLDPKVEHPLNSECDMWFTLSGMPKEEGSEEWMSADARFSPGHEELPDPTLFAEYTSDVEEFTDPESGLYDPDYKRPHYWEWLEDRYEGLAGALRDDPPKDRSELADTYHGLAAYLRELERMS